MNYYSLGIAIAGRDFTPFLLYITLMPNRPTVCVDIDITADDILEAREQFYVDIINVMPPRVVISHASTTIVIEGNYIVADISIIVSDIII